MSKHSRYRNQLRRRAIEFAGGRCSLCGFGDSRALQFDHITPVRRGANGLSKSKASSTPTYKAVLRGKQGYALLCANCHAIKTRGEDKAASVPFRYRIIQPEQSQQAPLLPEDDLFD